jgi:hypothetical protein
MQTEKHEQKGIGQEIVEAPKDRTFQGLRVGQIVESVIHRGRGNHKYIAFESVFAFRDEELTDIDSRIILILNEDDIDSSFIGKLARLKIIETRKTCYLAYVLATVGE